MVFLSPFLLMLGLMQLVTAHLGLRGVSLTGNWRWPGYLVGGALVAAGILAAPRTLWIFAALVPASLLALICLVGIGSWLGRNLDPACFLRPGEWPEGHCEEARIPHGSGSIPGLLITPPAATGGAVCLLHGSGDSKTAFKWRLIGELLRRRLTVLTIDLAGHGENEAPQRWPDCTAEIPAALAWLRAQPGVQRVGLLGISMGGALGAQAAAVAKPHAVVLCETPISLEYSPALVRGEAWHTLRSSILGLLSETTAWQIRQTWTIKQGRREIGIADLIRLLDVPGQVARLTCPVLFVYAQRDDIAPPDHGRRLSQLATAPSRFVLVSGASHLTLILLPQAIQATADWFAQYLTPGAAGANTTMGGFAAQVCPYKTPQG
jgi:pimeloyl-ACP methyl ester carboxylesterase